MTKYEVTMTFTYHIETDDMKTTMEEMEFPLFSLDEDDVEFIANSNSWTEIEEEESVMNIIQCSDCGKEFEQVDEDFSICFKCFDEKK